MTLDTQDYKDILTLIQRMEDRMSRFEDKIDLLRRDFVAANVQAIVNSTVDEKFKDQNKRIERLENAVGLWVMRGGVIAALLVSFIDMLIGLKVIP